MKRLSWLVVVLLSCQAMSAATGALTASADEVTKKRIMTGPSAEEIEVTLRRELAYGLTLYDGEQYQATFCPKEIGTIYLRAGVDNVIMASVTDVYYWPLTKEYMADWMGVNDKQQGVLEIRRGSRLVKTLLPRKYVLRYPEGPLGKATELMVVEQAEAAAKSYAEKTKAYYDAMDKYYREYAEYDKQMANRSTRVGEIPVEPKKPIAPTEYVMEPNEGFVVNLPPGTYQMEFKGPDGRPVPGGARKLVSFPVLSTGTGYDILPEAKWTSVTESNDRSQSIFALGDQVLYLQPYTQEQYDAYQYLKLTQLSAPTSGRGLQRRKTWIHLAPPTGELTLEVLRGSKVIRRITEKGYYVKQRPGYALGYEILEFAAQDFPDEVPAFSAYRVEMPKDTGRYGLRLVDKKGAVLPGSQRSLRTIPKTGPSQLAIIALLPLVIGLAVVGRRSLHVRRVRRVLEKGGRYGRG